MGYENVADVSIGFRIKLHLLLHQLDQSNRETILRWVLSDGFLGDCDKNEEFYKARDQADSDASPDSILSHFKAFHDKFLLIPMQELGSRSCRNRWGITQVN
jgi:hypothetical protein